jgi:hypothetical protein
MIAVGLDIGYWILECSGMELNMDIPWHTLMITDILGAWRACCGEWVTYRILNTEYTVR